MKNVEQFFKISNFKLWALCLSLLISSITFASAQGKIEFTYKSFGLEDDNENYIQNASHLEDFFENLYQLKLNADRKINIVHIGDSHIQADYLTAIVRRNFQKEFGNAGRGLVVPARMAGTNEAFTIKSVSSTLWKSKKCIHLLDPLPIGIGGITINTDQPNARLIIYMNDLWLDYSFNALTLFFQKDMTSFDFSVRDTSNREISKILTLDDPFVNYSRVTFMKPVNAFTLETVKNNPEQIQGTIFGLNLENNKNGVLYHAVGVNGAKYEHYNAARYFARQTAALTPDVFIISLGTNESLNYPYLDRNFYSRIDKLVNDLRANNPLAKFILVTPTDSFRKKIKLNPGIAVIREQIVQYAVENGLAFWDMHKALGSAAAWRQKGLLRNDGIHYTKDAYEYQGNLLYSALIKSYNQYVPLRHP